MQPLEIVERIDIIGEIRDRNGHELEAEVCHVSAEP
jgi:hypothetical protein